MKNKNMVLQINNLQMSISTFLKSLELAALEDDGIVSKEEEKLIKKIRKESEKYWSFLDKIKE